MRLSRFGIASPLDVTRAFRNFACTVAPMAVAGLLLAGCNPLSHGADSPVRCSGTEVGDPNEVLAGCLVDDQGQPAVGALVRVVPSAQTATAKIAFDARAAVPADSSPTEETVHTDAHGRYAFSDLAAGKYDILFLDSDAQPLDSGKTIMLKPRVVVPEKGSRNFAGIDTLKAPGVVEGTLSDRFTGEPLRGGVCYVPGGPLSDSIYADSTDQYGRFVLFLPEGNYVIRCQWSPYTPTETNVSIVSHKGVEVELTAAGKEDTRPLPPSEVRQSYDSLAGVVKLNWSRVQSPGVFGYMIKRVDSATFPAVNPTLIFSQDTVFYDVVYGDKSDTISKTLFYSICTVKADMKFGKDWSPAQRQTVTPPTPSTMDIFLRTPGDKQVFTVGDTARIIGEYFNRTRLNTQLAWKVKGNDSALKVLPLSNHGGADTLAFPCTTSGVVEIDFSLSDESGKAATSGFQLSIKP